MIGIYPVQMIKLLAVTVLIGVASSALSAEDWPQWRGPNRDNAWHKEGILETFQPSGLKTLWRVEVGYGYSSPVVAQGRVYLTDTQLVEPKAFERIHCFDQASGKMIWSHVYEAAYPDWVFTPQGHRGATPTPIVRDERLYVLDGMARLFCFDAATGRILWEKELSKEYTLGVPECGTDSSPLIEGDLLIILLGGKAGSSLIALNQNTGKEVWRALEDRRPYSSPIAITAGGRRQLIVWTSKGTVASLDPATGQTFWQEPIKTSDYPVATPVYCDGMLLLSGTMFKLDPQKPAATLLWPQKISQRVLSNTSTPLLQGGYVYSARSSGQLVCLRADTGEQVWESDKVTDLKSGAAIHITPIGDRSLLYTERGELILARLSPTGFQEISRAAVITPPYPFGGRNVTWSPPAYADRCIFARTDKELVCVSLAAER